MFFRLIVITLFFSGGSVTANNNFDRLNGTWKCPYQYSGEHINASGYSILFLDSMSLNYISIAKENIFNKDGKLVARTTMIEDGKWSYVKEKLTHHVENAKYVIDEDPFNIFTEEVIKNQVEEYKSTEISVTTIEITESQWKSLGSSSQQEHVCTRI
jgi:adenylate kinase family enzyme